MRVSIIISSFKCIPEFIDFIRVDKIRNQTLYDSLYTMNYLEKLREILLNLCKFSMCAILPSNVYQFGFGGQLKALQVNMIYNSIQVDQKLISCPVGNVVICLKPLNLFILT